MTNLRHAPIATALGDLTLVADGDDVTGLYFPGHWHLPPESAYGERIEAEDDRFFGQVAFEIDEYLSGDRRDFSVSTQTHGDDFSERVWAVLKDIPYGQTTTYGAIAQQMGDRHLAQRVGQCVGRNPVSIIIPCHRVVGANGSLTGYAGGLERKQFLLELEEPAEAASARLF